MKKRLFIALIAVLTALSMSGGLASAHVHGVTPLRDCDQHDPNAGGNGTNGTPADVANGGPITGLIPRDTGSGNITGGQGGFGATDGHCPD